MYPIVNAPAAEGGLLGSSSASAGLSRRLLYQRICPDTVFVFVFLYSIFSLTLYRIRVGRICYAGLIVFLKGTMT